MSVGGAPLGDLAARVRCATALWDLGPSSWPLEDEEESDVGGTNL
jgi:hypothetical protein